MGLNGGVYKALLVLHIGCAILGFGAVALNGLYHAKSRRLGGAEGAAVSEANLEVSRIGEYLIYAVFVLGILLVLTSKQHGHGGWEFKDAWLSASMGLYIVGVGISHAVVIPAHKRYNALARQGGSDGAATGELADVERRLAIGGAVLDLMLLAILFLMVWKPGA